MFKQEVRFRSALPYEFVAPGLFFRHRFLHLTILVSIYLPLCDLFVSTRLICHARGQRFVGNYHDTITPPDATPPALRAPGGQMVSQEDI